MFLEDITKWLDDASPVDVVYLDFHKAFDKVPYQSLLIKLKAYGLGEIRSVGYKHGWQTEDRVIVEGEISNWKLVLSGVPQGLMLGPILFLIFIND